MFGENSYFLMVLGNALGYSESAQLLISSQPWLKEQKLWFRKICHLCLVQNNAAAVKYNGRLLFSTSPQKGGEKKMRKKKKREGSWSFLAGPLSGGREHQLCTHRYANPSPGPTIAESLWEEETDGTAAPNSFACKAHRFPALPQNWKANASSKKRRAVKAVVSELTALCPQSCAPSLDILRLTVCLPFSSWVQQPRRLMKPWLMSLYCPLG